MVPQLPSEIIIDILARLPVKPLFRFKCVCKSWLFFILADSHFAKLHLHYAKQDTTVNRCKLFLSTSPFQSMDQDAFCDGNNNATRELSCSVFAVPPDELTFFGSCNGLIAAFWHDEGLCDCDDTNPNMHIIVLNPTTGDFRKLPASDSSMDGEIFTGFGYDSKLDDYKIVRGVAFTPGSEILKMELFSLKANEWRSSQDLHCNFSLDGRIFNSEDGFLHWLGHFQKDPDKKSGIVSFDLGEEKFIEMVPVPDHILKNVSCLWMQRVGDNVCLCTNAEWNTKCCEGWIMKRDGSEISWRKLYAFSFSPDPSLHALWIDVIWVAENGNVLLDVDASELIVYNPETEQFSLVYGLKFGETKIIAYMETLVSPNAS